ncbi:membrane protein [Pseudorhizobium pelagicum]|uniref:Membrane protein n=1 Tax=Pseudorhizobium pelagicum TaxID=1509405 RepID=A0A922P006_9HYPH|nr:membrane protein [Pseudorhizobium pelagicum]KEQ08648.1 membrane protein [Pseudorhizobium pelagicum]
MPQGTVILECALLSIMTMFFAVLALDIAMPAVVLSLMALLRWLATMEFHLVQPGRRTA